MSQKKFPGSGKSPRTSSSSLTSVASTSSLQTVDDQDLEDRDILLSFGKHYRGVVGDSPNHPDVFNLPAETNAASRSPVATDSEMQGLAKPLPTLGCLFLWSPDSDQQRALGSLEEMEEDESQTVTT